MRFLTLHLIIDLHSFLFPFFFIVSFISLTLLVRWFFYGFVFQSAVIQQLLFVHFQPKVCC
jgi:hypothetical protein